MNPLVQYLNTVPLAALMLVVTLGYLLSRLSWRGLSLGPAGGTLAVAILLGAAGLTFRGLYGSDEPSFTLGAFGFSLFIYSVGFEAGPRFFDFLRGGRIWRFAAVATLVNLLALLMAVASGHLLGLGEAETAGLLAGALTSAPTYAAAVEVCRERAPLAVAFVLTYPLGLVGVVLLVQFLPRLMGDVLYRGTAAADDEERRARHSPELRRVFEVQVPAVMGRSLAELDLTHRTGCTLTRLHRGSRFYIPGPDTRLERGDHVMAKGQLAALRAFEQQVGPEVFDDEIRRALPSPRAVVVSHSEAVGRSLAELELVRRFGVLVTEVLRGGVALEAEAGLRLARDDVVMVAGSRDDVRAAARALGRFERSTQETDIAIYAGGIFLGLLLGTLRFHAFGAQLQVGAATGLLATGVLLGRFRRIGPFSAHVPVAARQLVRDLGILLFVAETGVRAGGSPLGDLRGLIWPTLTAAVATTVLAMAGALVVARYLLKMRPIDAWGSVCGGMTSSAALIALRHAADSNEPAISYAAAYAVASVLATLAGRFVVYLM